MEQQKYQSQTLRSYQNIRSRLTDSRLQTIPGHLMNQQNSIAYEASLPIDTHQNIQYLDPKFENLNCSKNVVSSINEENITTKTNLTSSILLHGTREMPIDVRVENISLYDTHIKKNVNHNLKTKISDDTKLTNEKNATGIQISKTEHEEPGKFKNFFNKILYKASKSSNITLNHNSEIATSLDNNTINIEKEREESNVGKSLRREANLLHCYDNPSFSPNGDPNHPTYTSVSKSQLNENSLSTQERSEYATLMDRVDGDSCTNQHQQKQSSINIEKDTSQNLSKSYNMNMKSTSAQTNITSFKLQKNGISRSTPDFYEGSQLSLSSKGPVNSSNRYITTSSISSEAVIEVAKALRAKMQHNQKQKEFKHRQAMETSSVRYDQRHNSLGDLSIARLKQVTDNNISNKGTNMNNLPCPSVSAIIDSIETSLDKKDICNGTDTNSVSLYFPNNSSNGLYYKDFSSMQINSSLNPGNIMSLKDGKDYASLDYMYDSNYRNDIKTNPVKLKTFQSPQKERNNINEQNSLMSFNAKKSSNIVYAELSFPNKRDATFNVFNPDRYCSLNNDRDYRTNYTTLIYPPPSPNITVKKYDEIEI